jgi:hypothetical protein
MASSININQNNNVVTLQDNNGSLSITNNNTGTTVNVTQPVTNVVAVATPGPQGPVGPIPTSGAFTGSFSGSFTGSLQGTASNAVSASYALTASYLEGYISPFPYSGSAVITGSLTVSGSSTLTNIGPAIFSGSLIVTQGITGSLLGTASNAVSASYAINATSASNALTASYVQNAQTASYVQNAVSASYAALAQTANTASYVENAQTASYVLQAVSASFATNAQNAQTASYVENAQTASYVLNAVSASYAVTSSYSVSSSYALNATSASNALTASFLNTLNQDLTFNGNLTLNGTASIGTLVVNQTVLSTGSNQLGDAADDTQTLYGTVVIPTGSLTVTGSVQATGGFTGSFSGSVAAPGSTTQIIYNNGGVLGANSGFVYNGSNVGIGTTSPSVKLEIADSIPVLRITGTRNASWTIDQTMASLEYFSEDASGTAANSVRASINLVNETSVFGSTTGLSFSTKGDVAGLPTERMRINASGNVGIGTTAPTAKLQVKGSGTTSATTAFGVENANASSSMVVLDNGNVGVGTTSPGATLDIISTTGNTLRLRRSGYDTYTFRNSVGTGLELYNTTDTRSEMFFDGTGNVGIGTTSPAQKLHVDGAIVSGNITEGVLLTSATGVGRVLGVDAGFNGWNDLDIRATSATQLYLSTSGDVVIGATSSNYKFGVTGGHIGVSNGGNIYVGGFGADAVIGYLGNTSGVFTLRSDGNRDISIGSGTVNDSIFIEGSNGNVGIGTLTPTSRLQVKGSGTTSATTAFRVENANASGSMVVLDDGNVGIGTTSPTEKLHVAGDIAITNAIGALNFIYSATQTRVARLDSDNGNLRIKADVNGTQANSFISFNIDGSEKMRITSAGNVGIGTTTPSYKLDVSGSGNFTNNLTVTGSLIAGSTSVSSFTASNATISGNVTVLGTASINSLIVNQIGYSSGSNQLGDAADDTQTLYGTVVIPTGSLTVTGSTFISSSNATQLRVGNNSLFVSSSGNVGIGTTSPTSLLTLQGNNLITFTAVSAQNQISTIETDSSDNLLITAGIGSGKTITIGNKTNRILRIGGGTNTYQNSVHDFKDFLGISQLYIDSTSNLPVKVGIGTTTPTSRLQVKGSGTTSATTAFRVENANASSSMVVLDNGNVGIGTTNPGEKLHVYNAGNSFIKIDSDAISPYMAGVEFLRSSINGGRIYNDGSAVQVKLESYFGYDAANPTRGGFMFKTAPITSGTLVDAVRIDARGYVGIGTTTPTARLHVSGNLLVTDGITGSFSGSGLIESASFSSTASYVNPLVQDVLITGSTFISSSNATQLQVGNNLLFVSGSGNVGIGTTAPAEKLDIRGKALISGSFTGTYPLTVVNHRTNSPDFIYLKAPGLGSNDGVTINQETNVTGRPFVIQTAQNGGWGNLTLQRYGGNVGIGTITPTSRLQVKGTGTTSATTAFRVENANASASLVVFDDQTIQINNTLTTNQTYLQLGQGGSIAIRLNSTSQRFAGPSYFENYIQGYVTDTRIKTYDSTKNIIFFNSSNVEKVRITNAGNVGIGRTPTSSLDVAGTTRISGSFNTAASGSILTVIGSGSAQPIFTVQGSQGELFSITDSLSGSLFSVNDISGLPILEVFSDNTTLIGNYQDPMLITTAKVVQTNSGSFTVYSLPTASYDTAFFEYSIRSGSNARAGTIMAIQLGSTVNFTETTTTDFGDTTAVSFTVIVTGSNMALTGSSTSGAWTTKCIIRGI